MYLLDKRYFLKAIRQRTRLYSGEWLKWTYWGSRNISCRERGLVLQRIFYLTWFWSASITNVFVGVFGVSYREKWRVMSSFTAGLWTRCRRAPAVPHRGRRGRCPPFTSAAGGSYSRWWEQTDIEHFLYL